MLILTAKRKDNIFINDDIIVQVLSADRGQVRLGFVADPSVTIDREKIHNAKLKDVMNEKIRAQQSKTHFYNYK